MGAKEVNMKGSIMAYWEQLEKKYRQVKIIDDNNGIIGETLFIQNSSSRLFKVNLFSSNVIIEKEISSDKLEELLKGRCKYKMVSIASKRNKKGIYSVLNKVSKANGVCSPFVELEDSILYFPQLRYSDFGLIRHLCEQKELQKYKLLIVSGN